MFNLGYSGRNVDLCLIHFRVIEKFGGFDWYVAQCHGMLGSGQHGVARLSRPAPSNLLFCECPPIECLLFFSSDYMCALTFCFSHLHFTVQGKPSKTMVDCLAIFVVSMEFSVVKSFY
jgi:hypothetical protein